MSGSSSGTENVCLVDPMNSISGSSTLMISTGMNLQVTHAECSNYINWIGSSITGGANFAAFGTSDMYDHLKFTRDVLETPINY